MIKDTNQLRSAQQIGREEFVSLLVRHDRRLRCFVATMLVSTHDIEEVVQNTCLVAWRKIDTFTYQGAAADEPFVRWLCTIARYEVLTWRRTRSANCLVFEDSVLDRLAQIQLQESSYFEQRHQALIGCIQKLRPRDREMSQSFYDAQASVADLAGKFGIGVDAVYKSLSRIRATLLDCIQRTLRLEECR